MRRVDADLNEWPGWDIDRQRRLTVIFTELASAI
jgi:hypothetical protein